jgi:trans-aconitate methyltransferase
MNFAEFAPGERYPLDYESRGYAYLERPNSALLRLLEEQVLGTHSKPLIVDVGCGCGANARAIRELCPAAEIIGIEPDPGAANLAREVVHEVFAGTAEAWLATSPSRAATAVVLSDVLEHVVEPVRFLRQLLVSPALHRATWIISVPNYAVWYNRMRTLAGRFEYGWSGLYDRTHLRFFTRQSIRRLLEHCGLEITAETSSPSLVQSLAPLLRRRFERAVAAGHHLALTESEPFRLYSRYVEPVESRLCELWPGLLGFQIVLSARARM